MSSEITFIARIDIYLFIVRQIWSESYVNYETYELLNEHIQRENNRISSSVINNISLVEWKVITLFGFD